MVLKNIINFCITSAVHKKDNSEALLQFEWNGYDKHGITSISIVTVIKVDGGQEFDVN